jgi:hypothetical protein
MTVCKDLFGGEARWKAGETQGWCKTCERWQFVRDIAACPEGARDLATEAKIEAFYRRENRRGPKRKRGEA